MFITHCTNIRQHKNKQNTFHPFRHWVDTMLFHKTKNIIYVQQKLGHRCIENTMAYTPLINFESDEWRVAHAKTLVEEDKL
jgi:integrase